MTRTTDSIVFAIDQLHAIGNCVDLHRISFIIDLDEREGWREDGAPSIEHWVSMHLGKSLARAYEEVRVARALPSLPAIAQAFGEGLLSWEKVADVCSFATPADDEEWAEQAQCHSAARVRRWARLKRRVSREEAARADRKRTLRMWWDDDVLHFEGTLPGADGALFKKAIDRRVQKRTKPPDGEWPSLEEQRADALVDLAADSDGSSSSRGNVVIHVDARELERDDGVASLESGPVVSSMVVERLVCDGYAQVVIHAEDGRPVGIGRRSRTVPKWLEDQVRERDRVCVCCADDEVVGSEIHHVIPWSRGGRTDLDNLVLVCRRCHRLLHERGFSLRWDKHDAIRLSKPNGHAVNDRPERLRPEIRDRMVGPPPRREPLRC